MFVCSRVSFLPVDPETLHVSVRQMCKPDVYAPREESCTDRAAACSSVQLQFEKTKSPKLFAQTMSVLVQRQSATSPSEFVFEDLNPLNDFILKSQRREE